MKCVHFFCSFSLVTILYRKAGDHLEFICATRRNTHRQTSFFDDDLHMHRSIYLSFYSGYRERLASQVHDNLSNGAGNGSMDYYRIFTRHRLLTTDNGQIR